ncbi:MAG: hypothetical protein EHM24_06425 [Acidobacteria bacterium]|nr:MAG: hypothetical protein EHM24_06425 [Acidobacteriota bacterium]
MEHGTGLKSRADCRYPATCAIVGAIKELAAMGQIAQTGRFLRRWWPVVLAAGVLTLVTAFVGLLWFIQIDAHRIAQDAQRQYAGDEVQALILAVQDEQRPLGDRNHDVWALGQLRDPRAVPVLSRYYTGAPCQHDKFLCQLELKKAIDLCTGWSASTWLRTTMGRAFPKKPS